MPITSVGMRNSQPVSDDTEPIERVEVRGVVLELVERTTGIQSECPFQVGEIYPSNTRQLHRVRMYRNLEDAKEYLRTRQRQLAEADSCKRCKTGCIVDRYIGSDLDYILDLTCSACGEYDGLRFL